jgi:pilus assembly protein CpaB
MKTRGIAVTLALLLAIGATGAVFLYVQGVRKQAKVGSTVGVRVIVSKTDIRGGTELDNLISAGNFTTTSVPQLAVVEGAVTEVGQLQNRATTQFIAAGEQITTKRLSGSSTSTGGVLNIPSGYQALTLNIDAEHRVAGFVAQGDHVEVWGCVKPSNSQECILVTVVPDVEVLRVGTADSTVSSSSSTTPTASPDYVSLALLPNDAARVIGARQNGDVWFTLLPPGETGVKVRPVTGQRLLR